MKQKSHVAYSDIRSKFHVSGGPTRPSAIEYGHGHTPGTKTYRRHGHGHTSINQTKSVIGERNSNMLAVAGTHHHMLRSSDDNLVLSTSSSASKMNEISPQVNGIQVQPRLSKSEENLIDLDTPDGLGLGLTLENPLYDLLTDNNVFEDSDKTDAELLNEYGLTDYFAQMNFSGGSDAFDVSGSDIFNSSSNSSSDQLGAGAIPSHINANGSGAPFGASWTKFE